MTTKPLCIDLFCGLGGWTEGFLSEGYEVIGFDIEQHIYGEHRYPAQLVLQDVGTLHGSQFKDATIIVASSPCQEFSYRAMPWKRAKALGPPVLGMELFAQAGRIQREASEAAGRHIPMIQENVRGAQPWVGKAQWHYGSYYLWGDIPALMLPTTRFETRKRPTNFHANETGGVSPAFNSATDLTGQKNTGGLWFNIPGPGGKVANNNPARGTAIGEGRKNGGDWFGSGTDCSLQRRASSGSKTRKAASARIAKIPFPLAQWIARVHREAVERAA